MNALKVMEFAKERKRQIIQWIEIDLIMLDN